MIKYVINCISNLYDIFLKKGSGHILPLEYAIVDFKNDASWTWYFEYFKKAYGVRQNMCFMLDRNESMWKGNATVYPEFEHYACIWHLSCKCVEEFQ